MADQAPPPYNIITDESMPADTALVFATPNSDPVLMFGDEYRLADGRRLDPRSIVLIRNDA